MHSIKSSREIAQISESQMAKLIGVSIEKYRRYECYNEEMSVEQAMIFSRRVNIPIDNIIFFAH